MKNLEKIKDKLMDELDELARKPEMSAGDLETIHKLPTRLKTSIKSACTKIMSTAAIMTVVCGKPWEVTQVAIVVAWAEDATTVDPVMLAVSVTAWEDTAVMTAKKKCLNSSKR